MIIELGLRSTSIDSLRQDILDEGVCNELDDLLRCDEGVGNELDALLRCDEGVAILDDVKVDLKELSEILVFIKEAEVVNTLHGVKNNIEKDKHSRIVQWIIRICKGFLPATFFSCISLFDRTLVKGSITSSKLRLVAVTSLLIFGKFEEPKKLYVGHLLQLTNAEYTRKDVLKMEEQILKEVSWRLYSPTVHTFLRYNYIFSDKLTLEFGRQLSSQG
ncbi:cyclin-A3-3-like [Rhododendron vialii]|uniref:cyclin-A3-3-like n=1 Tax=Rhododendron vialii TaxID=182163 RepID=UPI00265E59DE|nr:cyclin-A3-3-like [Rhododendron vialii]